MYIALKEDNTWISSDIAADLKDYLLVYRLVPLEEQMKSLRRLAQLVYSTLLSEGGKVTKSSLVSKNRGYTAEQIGDVLHLLEHANMLTREVIPGRTKPTTVYYVS